MLAAYNGVANRHCLKCSKTFDRHAVPPVLLKAKTIKTDWGDELKWTATHLSCEKP